MTLLIEDAWRDFEIQVVPLDAPDVQRVESRRAFYAGAAALFAEMTTGLTPGPDAEQQDLAKLDGIKAELDQYVVDLQNGRA